ncbi:MAG: four helix bundle suffix domain-containing protein [Chlamydiales bacterium]
MNELIPTHGGYRKLVSFQLARLIFDITVRFCSKFISSRSRTQDQMVQAARSGVQNIAEGSQASGTSKKTELKLTNVARASLEELILDYEDYLRQFSLQRWKPEDSRRHELIQLRPATADQFALWVKHQHERDLSHIAEIAANGALILLSIACKLLDKQIMTQAATFEREGGFTERLYRQRSAVRHSRPF